MSNRIALTILGIVSLWSHSFSQLIYRNPRVLMSERFASDKGINNPGNFCAVPRGIALLNIGLRAGDPEAEPNFMVCADLTYNRVVTARYTSNNVHFSLQNNIGDPTGLVFDDQRNFWVLSRSSGSLIAFNYNLSTDALVRGATYSGFNKPVGLAYIRHTSSDARLYVIDPEPGTIKVLNSSTGALMQSSAQPEFAFAYDMTTGWNVYRPATPKFLYVLTQFYLYKIDAVTLAILLEKNLREDPNIGSKILPYALGSGPNGEVFVIDAANKRIHMLAGDNLAHIWSSEPPPGNGSDPFFHAPFEVQSYFNSVAVAQSIRGDLGPEVFFIPARIDQLDILSTLPLPVSSPLTLQFRTTGRGELEFILHKPSGAMVSYKRLYDAGTSTFQFPASDLSEFGIGSVEVKLRLGDVHSTNPTPTSILSKSFQVIFPLLLQMKDNGLSEPNISKPQIKIQNLSSALSLRDFTVRLWASRQEMPSQAIVADGYYFNPSGIQMSVGSDSSNPNLVFVDLKYPSGYSIAPGQGSNSDGAQLGVHFRNYYPGVWNRTNDWSWLGITSAYSATRYLTVYDNSGNLLFGEEPTSVSLPQPPQLTTTELLGFEKLFAWGSEQAGLSLSSTRSQGAYSLQILGGGYMTISSLPAKTLDFTGETSHLALDVFIPGNQPNPYWIGGVDMYVDCPSASMQNVYLGHIELTGFPQNRFSVLQFNVPSQVLAALQGNYSDFSFKIALNVNAGTAPFLFDNLRFVP